MLRSLVGSEMCIRDSPEGRWFRRGDGGGGVGHAVTSSLPDTWWCAPSGVVTSPFSFLQGLITLFDKFFYIFFGLCVTAHFRLSFTKSIFLLFLFASPTRACPTCPGDPLIDTPELPSLLCATLTIATFNCRGGLFAAEAARLKSFAAAMLKHSIHALSLIHI